MLPSAQHVAIDLTRNTLQVTDSTVNNVGSTEPDGAFAALLVPPPAAAGQPVPNQPGSELPPAGSELPPDIPVPADAMPAEFVAFFADDDTTGLPATAGRLLRDTGDGLPAQGNDAELMGVAPLPTVGHGNELRVAESMREDGRIRRRNEARGEFIRRDHGRMPFAQPMAPPDRLIFKTAGQDGLTTSITAATGNNTIRDALPANLQTASGDRPNPGFRLPGLLPGEQGSRLSADAVAALELPGQKDGMESLARSTSPVQVTTSPGQVADLPQLRDLAAATKPTPVLATSIDRPVIDEAWGEAFQNRILWMTKGGIQNAEIRLNPAELGPIRVQVSVEDDTAILQFTAQHNTTREAIEQALPRLREMLSDNGLTLADFGVNDSGVSRDNGGDNDADAEFAVDAGESVTDANDPDPAAARRIDSSSLVDTFA